MRKAIYIEEPPEIEFRNGMFHVIGGDGEWVMRPSTFMRTVARAATTAREYNGGADIINLREAASV